LGFLDFSVAYKQDWTQNSDPGRTDTPFSLSHRFVLNLNYNKSTKLKNHN